jgi:uncharacterized protein (DUF2141 family)
MHTRIPRVRVFLAALALFATASAPRAASAAEITGAVTGCTGEHTVYIALYGSDIFDGGEAVDQVVRAPRDVANGRAAFVLRGEPGWYTIAVYEDRNGNRELDMGLLGPKEPAAFHRPHTRFGPPRFDSLRFELHSDQHGIEIPLP